MSGETDSLKWRGVRPVAGIRGVWPAIDAVRVRKMGYQDGIGTQEIYIVPANKVLFISSAAIACRQDAVAQSWVRLEAKNSVDALLYYLFFQYGQIAGQWGDSTSFLPALELVATDKITVYCSNAALGAVATIFGWLEDE